MVTFYIEHCLYGIICKFANLKQINNNNNNNNQYLTNLKCECKRAYLI